MGQRTRVLFNLRLDPMKTEDLIKELVSILDVLRRRGILRTGLVGDLGEHLAIEYYNSTKGLPKLQRAQPNAKNVDANSNRGERYSIKSTTTKHTGTFHGMNPPDVKKTEKKVFEHVIIVVLSKELSLQAVYELDWDGFLEHRYWIPRMSAYKLVLTKNVLADCIVRYRAEE